MSDRTIARIVWVIAGFALIATAYGWWSDARSGMFTRAPVEAAGAIAWSLVPVIFVLTGALIVSRQPKNIIGLLLMIPGLVFLTAGVVDVAFGSLETGAQPAELTVGLWLRLWFDNWSWVLLIFPILHLILVFPTGSLPSPRWRWVVWLEAAMILFMMLSAAFGEEIGPLNVEESLAWTLPNPIGFLPEEFFGAVFNSVWSGGLLLVAAAALTSLVLRFRRAAGAERQQMKWLVFAVAVFAMVYVGTVVAAGETGSGNVLDLIFVVSIMGIPVSIAIAVLRFHLYDLGRVIRRTLLYAVLSGLLVGIFILSVFLVRTTIGGLVGEDSALGIAVSTLLVAALFNPLRRRLQDLIDRRLYRSKYDAQRVIDRFVATARDEADMSALSADLLDLVDETIQPSVKGLWIKGSETPV
ncbi:MAG TPA: hypothetical protein VFV13_12355 [Acidimicrobiia bacterium]|nr:hypothetical protein [Acidimicrobiia bacterium]